MPWSQIATKSEQTTLSGKCSYSHSVITQVVRYPSFHSCFTLDTLLRFSFSTPKGFINGTLNYLLTLNIAAQKSSKNTITNDHQFQLVCSLLWITLKVLIRGWFQTCMCFGVREMTKASKSIYCWARWSEFNHRTHLVEEENWFLQAVFWLPNMHCSKCLHLNTQNKWMHKYIIKLYLKLVCNFLRMKTPSSHMRYHSSSCW